MSVSLHPYWLPNGGGGHTLGWDSAMFTILAIKHCPHQGVHRGTQVEIFVLSISVCKPQLHPEKKLKKQKVCVCVCVSSANIISSGCWVQSQCPTLLRADCRVDSSEWTCRTAAYVRHSLVRTLLQVSSKHRSTVLHSLCHWCINLMLYLCSLKHTLTPCLLYHSPPPLSSAVLNPSPPPPGLPSADNSVPSRCFCPRYQLFLHGIIRHNWFKYRKATSFCLHSVWTEDEETRTCLCVHVCSTPMEACMDTRHEFN